MKIIIWIVCLFVGNALKVLFVDPNFGGAIPTVVVYLLIFSSASWLSKKWGNKHPKNQEENTGDDLSFDKEIPSNTINPTTSDIRHRRTEKYGGISQSPESPVNTHR